MKYLIKKSFVRINRRTIDAHGGNYVPPDNFLHESVIDYTVEAVKVSVFGQPMYPTLADKAAFYMFQIVTGHVFQDGNKRTGLEAALALLQLNSADLRENLFSIESENERLIPEQGENPQDILENFTLEMASGKISLDEARKWFEENVVEEVPLGVINGEYEETAD
jgi:death on curing protein